jgi:ribosomal protein S19E (S16A)
VNLSGESLSKHFKEGRDVFRKAIKELENKGFVIRTREKINDDWVSTNRVTNSGMDYISESLNISLWSRELVVQPFNQSISAEEEIFKYIKEEIKKATAAS